MDDISGFNVLFITNDFKDESHKEIDLIPPKVCPICGSEEVKSKIDVYDKNHKRHFKAWACLRHSKLKGRPSISPCLYLWGLLILLVILLMIIQIIWWISFLLFISLISIFCLYERFSKTSRKYIKLEFFKFESIIYVKNNVWTNEFLKLNETKSRKFTGDLTPYNIFSSKIRKIENITGILVFLVPLILIVGLANILLAKVYPVFIIIVYICSILFIIDLILVFIFIFIFVGFVFKNYNKVEKIKHDILFCSSNNS